MNDLTSLRELGETIDTELRGPAPALRQRVLADLGRPPGRARPGGRPRPRFVPGWRLAVTGGMAVALAAALLAVSTLRLLGAPPGATAEAATILDRAAAAAARQPALHPRPSQYIFISGLGIGAVFDDSHFTRLTADLHQAWFSVNGTRKGLVRDQPRSPADLRRVTGPWESMTLAPGQPAYPALPTTAGAMLSYLYRTRQGQNPAPVEAFIHAGDLVFQSYLRPAELVALFGALKRLPGVSVVGHAVSIAGQRGIAVQQVFNGVSDQLIFNPRSYALIGNREVSVGRASGRPAGRMLSGNAILRIAVVNRAGQLP